MAAENTPEPAGDFLSGGQSPSQRNGRAASGRRAPARPGNRGGSRGIKATDPAHPRHLRWPVLQTTENATSPTGIIHDRHGSRVGRIYPRFLSWPCDCGDLVSRV